MSKFTPSSMFRLVLMSVGLLLLWGPVSGMAQPKMPSIPGSLPKLDLNTAPLDQLQKLPGLNEATAKQIIAGRPYKSLGELEKVGLSKPTIDKLAPMLTVGDVAKEAAPPEDSGQGATAEGNGLGQHRVGHLLSGGRTVVRENQGGQIYDRSRRQEGGLPRG